MKKIHLILLLGFSLILSSCSDQLDLAPQDKISDAAYWKTPEDYRLFANNFYNKLKSLDIYDLNSDLLSDPYGKNSESNGTYIAAEQSPVWDGNYTSIREVNYLLERASTYANPTEISKYVAEAHFFRAYFYHNLLFYYGDVPIIKKPLDTNSTELTDPRNSRKEVAEFIVNELNEAITVLPAEKTISAAEKGRISKEAAQALKARVALYEGTWQKFRGSDGNAFLDIAIAESRNIMNSNTFSLFTALGDSSYKYLFILENQKSNPGNFTKKDNHETILAKKYEFGVSTHAKSFELVLINPTRKIADMYVCKNGLPIESNPQFMGKLMPSSEFKNRDLRMINTFRIPGRRYYSFGVSARDYNNPNAPGIGIFQSTPAGYGLQKFITERNCGQYEEGYDFPIIRYAEVLLTFAEAVYERNGNISDADLNLSINLLRGRAGVAPLTNSLVNSNGLNMRTEIRRERTVELFMEDFRMDDLKRWHTAVEELTKPMLSILYTGTQVEVKYPDPTNKYAKDNEGYIVIEPASARKFSEKYYLHPIPLKQLFLNPNLKQNPGWE